MAIYKRTPRVDATTRLKEQFLKELESDATSVLNRLSQQFTQDIQSQLSQLLSDSANSENGLAGAGKLLATASSYVLTRPQFSQETEESGRSREAESRFRLSQSQALAEANRLIAKGDKNL